MAFHVLHEKTEESYDERLSLSLQSVKENSDVQEDLLSKMLLRLNLQLENCRGQHVTVPVRYWEKSGVATRITREQLKASAVYCYGHSLSLSVKQLTSSCSMVRRIRGNYGYSWLNMCYSKVFTEKRKFIGNNSGASRRGI